MSERGGIFTVDAGPYLARTDRVVVEPLGDGLWTAAAGSYRTIFLEGRSSVIAFNTFGTPAAACAYRAAIEETVPGKTIGALVVTIDHLDHAGCGAHLAPAATVVGHELTAAVIAGRCANGQLPVTRAVRGDGELVEIDGSPFELLYPGPTQGTGNLAAYFPDRQLLFVVGPQANARYGLFADIHCEQYAASMRTLLNRRLATVVPGRYEVMTAAQAQRAVSYFEALGTSVQHAFANGVPVWELQAIRDHSAAALADEWGDLDGFESHVGLGALRLVHHFLMGGWGIEDTQEPKELHARRIGV